MDNDYVKVPRALYELMLAAFTATLPKANIHPKLTLQWSLQLVGVNANANKVELVKAIRKASSMGLIGAKDAIDDVEKRRRVVCITTSDKISLLEEMKCDIENAGGRCDISQG